ncbi:MAG: NfeD family protein [Clostridia bacterium]|nr:NfeD family protein [Clostridia bacterium]
MELYFVWTIIIAAALLVEFFTMQMVSIWFAVGGVFGLVLSLIGGIGLEVQIIVSAVVALISIVFLRKFALKFLHKSADKNDAGTLVGKTAEVVEEISPEKAGAVKLNGVLWTATSEETLGIGAKVKIIDVLGNKLKVKGEL